MADSTQPDTGQDFAALLDAFEKKLDNYETDIKSRIADRYRQGINAEKPGVDAELNSAAPDARTRTWNGP